MNLEKLEKGRNRDIKIKEIKEYLKYYGEEMFVLKGVLTGNFAKGSMKRVNWIDQAIKINVKDDENFQIVFMNGSEPTLATIAGDKPAGQFSLRKLDDDIFNEIYEKIS